MNLSKLSKFYFYLIASLFIILRIEMLGFDQTNNDSQRWFIRSEGFLQALKSGNISKTHQKYHPGVTLMVINSFSRQFFYSYQYSFLNQKIDIMSPYIFPYTNLVSKLGVVLVVFLVLLLQFYLIKKIWGNEVALFYFFFISVEPFFIGINRWFHLTSFEVMFGFTSILLLLFWRENKKPIFFILSTAFLALGVLTKVTTLILGVVLFIVLLHSYLKTKNLSIFVFYFLSYLLFIFAFFPALWVDGYKVSSNIIGSIFNAVGEDPRKGQIGPILNIIYYPLVLVFKLSPILLVLFLLSFSKFKEMIKKFENLSLFLVLIVFLIFLSVSDQKIDRYSLVFYLPLILICSIFISRTSAYIKKTSIILSLIFIVWVRFNFSTQYYAYFNPFVGGTKTALNLGIYENGGSYFNESAFYLNKIAPNSKVFVPDNFEAYSLFYYGKSQRLFDSETEYVVSSLDIDRKEFNNYGCSNKISEFGPKDTPVVAVFKCK